MSRFFQKEEGVDLLLIQNIVHQFLRCMENQLYNFSDECQGIATEYKHLARSEIRKIFSSQMF